MILQKKVNFKPLKKFRKVNYFNFLLSLLFIFVITAMILQPEKYIAISLNSLLVWASVVLPAIFPFLIFSKFLTKFGVVDFFSKLISPITRFLFNTDGVGAYICTLSVISGYPVGAKITSDLYMDGRLDRGTANRVMTFSANSGPMFILGTVGIGMLTSAKVGYIILASHLLGAIINGLVFRNYKKSDTTRLPITKKEQTDDNFLYATAISSTSSMLVVGTYIVMFFVLIEFFAAFLVFPNATFGAIFNGLLEITHGAKDIALLGISMKAKTLLCTFIITFGGISTTIQSLAFLKKMKFSTSFFILLKTTHAVISTLICWLILLFFSV